MSDDLTPRDVARLAARGKLYGLFSGQLHDSVADEIADAVMSRLGTAGWSITRKPNEWEWGVREYIDGINYGVYAAEDSDINTEADAREFHAAYVGEAPGCAEVVRRGVHRGDWQVVPDAE